MKRQRRPADGGRFWAALPFALIGAMLLGFGFMVGLATDDPGFSVEDDYYQKALDWDAHEAERRRSELLGWRIAPEVRRAELGAELIAGLVDRAGAPVRGAAVEVRAFHVARGKDAVSVTLSERGAGEYHVTLPRPRPGIWELRFTAQRGAERYSQVSRIEIDAEDAS